MRFAESAIGPDRSDRTMRGEVRATSASASVTVPDRSGLLVVPPTRRLTSAVPSTPRLGTNADSTRSTATPSTVRLSAGGLEETSTDPPSASSLPTASHTTSSMVMSPLLTEMVVGRVCFTSTPAESKCGRVQLEAADRAHRVELRDLRVALAGERPSSLGGIDAAADRMERQRLPSRRRWR